MIGRVLLLATVVGAVVLVAQWSLQKDEDDTRHPDASAPEPSPFLRAALLEDFDATGQLRLRVQAARIELDPADDSVRLDDLALDYLARPGQTWHVTARHGSAPKGFATVELRGSVVLSGLRDREPRRAALSVAETPSADPPDSQRMPASFRPPTRTSLGHFTFASTPETSRTQRAKARPAASPTQVRRSLRSGRIKTDR